jgi:hypothetical protein
MFIAALFTIAKLWKHPRCPTTDEWIKKMWYLSISPLGRCIDGSASCYIEGLGHESVHSTVPLAHSSGCGCLASSWPPVPELFIVLSPTLSFKEGSHLPPEKGTELRSSMTL